MKVIILVCILATFFSTPTLGRTMLGACDPKPLKDCSDTKTGLGAIDYVEYLVPRRKNTKCPTKGLKKKIEKGEIVLAEKAAYCEATVNVSIICTVSPFHESLVRDQYDTHTLHIIEN